MNTFLKVMGGFGLAAAAFTYFWDKSRRDQATMAGKLGFEGGGTVGYLKGFGKGLSKGFKSALRIRA